MNKTKNTLQDCPDIKKFIFSVEKRKTINILRKSQHSARKREEKKRFFLGNGWFGCYYLLSIAPLPALFPISWILHINFTRFQLSGCWEIDSRELWSDTPRSKRREGGRFKMQRLEGGERREGGRFKMQGVVNRSERLKRLDL